MHNDSEAANDGKLAADTRADPAAFARLYRRNYDAVFRYCAHRLFERQTAEDVTAAVFLKAVENLGAFRGTERQFRNWLYRIATNAVNNHLRKAARRDRLLKAFGKRHCNQVVDCQDAADENAERVAILKEAMLSLRPRYQAVITLRFFENMSLTEIGEVLDSGPGTVRSQLARALAKLRKKIGSLRQDIRND